MVGWSVLWGQVEGKLPQYQEVLGPKLYLQSQECLQAWKEFATSADLAQLDRTLGATLQLCQAWDHHWWLARRQGLTWPFEAPESRPGWSLQRQSGWTRACWACPDCGWEVSYQVEMPAWEALEWPGPQSCPCC